MKKLALLVCVLALACERKPLPEAPTPAPAPAFVPDPEADNLLNLAYGASVVSRTGELNLESSAAHAIDNIGTTSWVSSPGAPDETLVFSLLAPARLTRVGLTVAQGDQVPSRVAFDTSMDGREWRELLVVAPHNDSARQLWPVPATVTRYVRLRSLEKEKYYVRVRTVHLLGDEVEPPSTPPFTGCWTVNGRPAQLVQDGARVTGTIGFDPPLHLEGGTGNNRVALVTWRQGPSWGHAALTRTPDGAHLTGLRIYEGISAVHIAEGWFGERERCRAGFSPPPSGGLKPALHSGLKPVLGSALPLYGLVFDDRGRLVGGPSKPTLDALVPLLSTPRRIRLRSHELRYDTPEENRRHTAAQIASLREALQARGVNVDRIDFVSAGSDWDGHPIHTTFERFFASRVELSLGT